MALKDEIGVFAWFRPMTSDPAKATVFYSELFGLTPFHVDDT
jgi:predicted enzyme related to lactoylglutathione lyase